VLKCFRAHWPEYLCEGAGLGLFMVSAGLFGTWLEAPGYPLRRSIDDPLLRRTLMGLAMGLTAIALIYSPLGRRSGGHFNPATTLTFWTLGKIGSADALAYIAAQFAGGLYGVVLVGGLLECDFL
jgi:aquaporin Z